MDARKNRRFSTAKSISRAQKLRLRKLLGDPPWSQVLRYMEWSNGYDSGVKPDGGWSAIHCIRAIDMAMYGANDIYTRKELLLLASTGELHTVGKRLAPFWSRKNRFL